MHKSKLTPSKRAALGVTAGVVAVGAGLGVAGLASAAPTPTPGATPSASSTADPGQQGWDRHGGGRHGRDGGALVSELATKLGVDEAKVRTALQEVRAENRASADPSAGSTPSPRDKTDTAAFAKALAEKLGVDEAKVQTALDEIRADRQSDRAAELKTRLDAAVQAGTLTQAEADAVQKAYDAGVIGGRR